MKKESKNSLKKNVSSITRKDAIKKMHKSNPEMLMEKKNANLITPGNVEDDLFKLELDAFMRLIETQKTQDRIKHTLATGKPLVN